ncbi:hypothetical protein ACFLT9_04445 [Acidobacteriota bacterium]
MLRTIETQIESDTRPFIFDTGGGLTFITPKLAKKIGAQPFGRITGFRMSGERIDVVRCGEIEYQVTGFPFRVETVLFDLMSLLPEGWPELGGLFSLDTFSDYAITLDLHNDRLIIESEDSLRERTASMKPASMRINHQTGGWGLDIFIEVAAQQGSLWLEMDTGNMGEVLLTPHALKQLGLNSPQLGETAETEDSDVFETALNLIGFGPIDVEARTTDLIYDGALNAPTIEKLVLTIDLRNKLMWAAGHK